MKACDKQYFIVDYFFHELDESQKKEFEQHLGGCALCRSQIEAFSAIAPLVKKQKRDQPQPGLLRQYRQQLKARYYPAQNFLIRVTKFFDFFVLKPSFSIRLAEALVLIVIGIFMGRAIFWKPESKFQIADSKEYSSSFVSSQLLHHYLQETEMILLDLANKNPNEDEEALLSLSQLARYRNLLQKTSLCRAEAEEKQNGKLIELTDEIELILLDLCNIEEKTLREKISEIKEQIENSNLLFELKNFNADEI